MPDAARDAQATPSHGTAACPLAPETPRALEIDVDVDSDPRRASPRAALMALRQRRTRQVGTAAVVVWVLAACVFTLAFIRHGKRARDAKPLLAASTPLVAEREDPEDTTDNAPPPATASAPAEGESRRGKIVPPASAAGHRIYVDGRVAGQGTAPLDVACGQRWVRVGSKGRWRSVHVPCNGVLNLE